MSHSQAPSTQCSVRGMRRDQAGARPSGRVVAVLWCNCLVSRVCIACLALAGAWLVHGLLSFLFLVSPFVAERLIPAHLVQKTMPPTIRLSWDLCNHRVNQSGGFLHLKHNGAVFCPRGLFYAFQIKVFVAACATVSTCVCVCWLVSLPLACQAYGSTFVLICPCLERGF